MKSYTSIAFISFLVAFSTISMSMPAVALSQDQKVVHWKNLIPTEKIGTGKTIQFFQLQTKNGSAASLIVIEINNQNYKSVPFFNQRPVTTSAVAQINGAIAAVNGGYFNLSDSQSTSYVVIDGQSQCDPQTNQALVENPQLQPYLKTIFNRSELRILKNDKAERQITISRHNDPLPAGWQLDSSIQAGPQLLPTLTDKEEAFIRTTADGKIIDSIGSHKPAARTACGTTPDGHLMLLCIASKGQDEFSSGCTLLELAEILKRLGCVQAINFDGGTSTTMVICNPNNDHQTDSGRDCTLKQVCGKHPEKLVKSGLMIVPLIP